MLAYLIEVAVWWGLSVGTWVVTLSTPNWPELWIASAAGLPCAVAATLGRRALATCWRPSPRWAWWLVPLLAAVVTDAVAVLVLPFRRGRNLNGEFVDVPVPSHEPVDRARARLAMATMTLSATPATFVVDTRPEQHKLIVHELVSTWPHLEKVVDR